jgi:hypothetical protein
MRLASILRCTFIALAAEIGAAPVGAAPAQALGPQARVESQVATSARDCLAGFQAPLFDPLRGKLAARAEEASQSMLALKDEPTRDERFALKMWIQIVALCRDSVLSTAQAVASPPEVVAIVGAAWERNVGKLVELYDGMIPYGEYNGWLRQVDAQTGAALRSVDDDLEIGTPQGAKRAAATAAQQAKLLQSQLESYSARLERWQRSARERGLSLSCTPLGAFTLCTP